MIYEHNDYIDYLVFINFSTKINNMLIYNFVFVKRVDVYFKLYFVFF